MKLLKRVIISIVTLLLLKGLTLLLDEYSPMTVQFHRQFLFCMQLLVIAWIILIAILSIFKKEDSWFARFLPVIILLLVLLLDMGFYKLLRNPDRLPDTLRVPFSNFYTAFESNILQYEPCMIYDSALFYKMIPGLRFSFGNIEYQNQYSINRDSFRDDEASLFGPQVICIGDSYTLGWGVEQEETFSELLSSKTNLNVLNGGNSSYGTVRELKELAYVDTSLLEYLVIQYCRNDFAENANYVRNNGELKISDEAGYRLARMRYQWNKEYFPGKYFLTIGSDWLRMEARYLKRGTRVPHHVTESQAEAAKTFLSILRRANLSKRIQLIVIDVNGWVESNDLFITEVAKLLKEPEYHDLQSRMKVVDVSKLLDRSHYYILDTHLNASGHRKLADTLAGIINVSEQAKKTSPR